MAYDPLSQVPKAQNLAATGVQGYGASLLPGLRQQIGTTLGNLNSAGALRSGAVPVALNDASNAYGQQVGNYAKMASGEALGAGLAANEQSLMKEQMDNERKTSLLGAVGQALGFAGSRIFPAKSIVKSVTS